MNKAMSTKFHLWITTFLCLLSQQAVVAQISTYPGQNSYGNQNSYGTYPGSGSSGSGQYPMNTRSNDHGLGFDSAKANDERSQYFRFQTQASDYQADIRRRLELIQNDEDMEKQKEQGLEQEMKHVAAVERGRILGQIEACRKELEKDESEKKLANLYLYRTNQWLRYEKGQVENAEYNVAEDQEAINEDAQKARQAEIQRAWEAQKLANAQYWQKVNNPTDYGYGYGSGYGYPYRHGRFRGYGYNPYYPYHAYHSSSGSHSSGSHGAGRH